MIKLIEILILIVPAVVFALWNGRNGIKHPNSMQVIIISIIMSLSSIIDSLYHNDWIYYYKSLAVSITGFGLIFNYAFNYRWWIISGKMNGTGMTRINYTFSHLSKTAFPDRSLLWIKIGPIGRVMVYISLFVLSLIWFLNG